MDNIIGKEYIPTDNSYSTCYTNGDTMPLLGGSAYSEPIVTTIIDGPLKEAKYEFVITKDPEGNIYKVLWDDRGLNLEDARERHQSMHDHATFGY